MPRHTRRTRPLAPLLLLGLLVTGLPAPAAHAGLDDELGRSEVRVLSTPYPLAPGVTVSGAMLPERLERLGYRRVHDRPASPGEYFWGHERFWIYRRAHDYDGDHLDARLLGLELRRDDGAVLAVTDDDEHTVETGEAGVWLEPEVLAESLTERRARRRPVQLAHLPERVWRPVLAAEDSRFFEHSGLDARGIARAMLANARAGKVVQGGSTVTQQLIKTRDLTPKRSFGRKISEAVRTLELEAEYDKEEILQAYLNHVYFGHLGGVGIYGLGAAARAYYSKPAAELDLAQAAVLAAMIQGPNRLSPVRHPQAARTRQEWVLGRMEELGWASAGEVAAARGKTLPHLALTPPAPRGDRQLIAWVAEVARLEAPERFEEGRGFLIETAFDAVLQDAAADAVEEHLARLRRDHRRLRDLPLSAAVVTLDARTGEVLVHVAGDPADGADAFDRVRQARRQPGSALKPLVLLEAFAGCGDDPLYPARRIEDGPVRVDLESGPWEPHNFSPGYRGTVTLRNALVLSLNTPFVRAARHCGFEETALRVRKAGVPLPEPAPPAFVLGAVETTPLDLARAFSVFPNLGLRVRPVPVRRVARPGGSRLARGRTDERRVVDPASAYLILDLLRDAVARGTGEAAALPGLDAWGKTGTSDERRDAWFVGGVGPLLTAVWVGIDDGTPLGLTGSAAAAPLWHEVMAQVAPSRPLDPIGPPPRVVWSWVQDDTGLRVRPQRPGSHEDLFRDGAEPPHRRLLRADHPVPVLR